MQSEIPSVFVACDIVLIPKRLDVCGDSWLLKFIVAVFAEIHQNQCNNIAGDFTVSCKSAI